MSENNTEEAYVHWIKKLAVPFIVVVLLMGVFFFFTSRKNVVNEKAADLMFEATRVVNAGYVQSQSYFDEEFIKHFNSLSAEKKKLFAQKLNDVTVKFPKSQQARLAWIYLGRLAFSEGDFVKAESHYRKATQVSSKSENGIFEGLAHVSLGVALESQEQFQKAFEVYKEAAEDSENPTQVLSHFGMARNLLKLGKKAEAIAKYENIVKKFPNTDYARKAKALVELEK